MKIGILGAGAIGSFFGGLLQHRAPHCDVVLVGRGPHAETVREQGALEILFGKKKLRVPVRMETEPSALADSDLLLICIKSQATQAAMDSVTPFIGHSILVTIQNGINDALFTQYVMPERVVAAMTAINVAIPSPGVVSLQLDGPTLLGPIIPLGEKAAIVACDVLKQTGLRVERTENIHAVRYNKLAMNALGYASCLSGSNFISKGIVYRPWRRHVAWPLLREVEEVLAKAEIPVHPIPSRPGIDGLRRVLHLLDWPMVGFFVGQIARLKYNRRPIIFSLYQDLLLGKKTEVDFINGQIVRLGQKVGMDTPFNELVVRLVHELEKRGAGKFFTRKEVIRKFAELQSGAARCDDMNLGEETQADGEPSAGED